MKTLNQSLRRGRLARPAWMVAACVAAALLTGCGGGGGGGSTPPPPPQPTAAVLTGTVTLPGSGAGTPISGATVSLFNPGTMDQAGDSVTTDANGVYRFTTVATPGAVYELRAQGVVDGTTRRLKTLVRTSPSSAPSSPVTANVNGSTTVALRAALVHQERLENTGSFTNPDAVLPVTDLFDGLLAQIQSTVAANPSLSFPDFSDEAAVDTMADTFLADLSPNGSFTGTFLTAAGVVKGKFAAILKDDSVMFLSFRNELFDSNYNDGVDGFIVDIPVAYGTVEDNHVITATTEDSLLQITGTFVNGVAMGEWEELETGLKGTWRATTPVTATNRFDGVYGGAFDEDSSGQGAGQFALLVTGGNVWLFGFDSLTGFGVFGAGTVNAQGQIAYRWQDLEGNTGNSTGTVSEGVATGTLRRSPEESFAWTSQQDYDPLGGFGPPT